MLFVKIILKALSIIVDITLLITDIIDKLHK